jgi:nitrogen fixation protein NifZ
VSERHFEYGEAVRVIRNIRDDGTFPGAHRGRMLIPRGSIGFVRNRGTFLQDQVIYEIHFIECGGMVVGCREEELIDADAEWRPSLFEFREQVLAAKQLVINGEMIAAIGDEGQVIKVVPQGEEGIAYHVHFSGRTLMVPEAALNPKPQEEEPVEEPMVEA